MKKDLQSYEQHNHDYKILEEFYSKENIIERTERTNDFVRTGFKYALSITTNRPKTHIDIGSGVGWLVRKMAPHFENSIGIEPSHAAINAAKELTKDLHNVSFVEKDMIDAYKELNIIEPAFFTTGAVLSHIENYYVEEFLKLLNNAPTNSVLFFSENYDRNIDWAMWHIRSKEWWRKKLSNWQLTFLDIENGGYASGIYGIKLGSSNILKQHKRGFLWEIYWFIDKYKNIIERVIKKILRSI